MKSFTLRLNTHWNQAEIDGLIESRFEPSDASSCWSETCDSSAFQEACLPASQGFAICQISRLEMSCRVAVY